MAAGYNSLSVTKNSSGVAWSFNATAASSGYPHVMVVCGSFSAEVYENGQTASVTVTGSAAYGSADYLAGSKTYTIEQWVRAGYDYEWALDGTTTCTVSWDTATLRVVSSGSVKVCSNIKVVSGGQVKTVTGVYSVKNGQVKPGI